MGVYQTTFEILLHVTLIATFEILLYFLYISKVEKTATDKQVSCLFPKSLINAGGTGLNLENFNTVYFTSPSWNPSLKDQAIARAHRIGQKNQVNAKV